MFLFRRFLRVWHFFSGKKHFLQNQVSVLQLGYSENLGLLELNYPEVTHFNLNKKKPDDYYTFLCFKVCIKKTLSLMY